MKIAVTAVADSVTAEMDPRFGRARWIALHDTESGETEFLDNIAGVEATGGAGVQTANLVLGAGVEVLVTGHVGPKAAQALGDGLKIIESPGGTVAAAIEKAGKVGQ